MNIETLLANANYIPIRPTSTGAMYRATYRGDTSPSLSVDYEKNVYYDHGTASGGDIASLYALIYNCSIGEALRTLRDSECNTSPVAAKVQQTPRKCPIEITAYREIRKTDATGKYLAEKRGLTHWENLYHVNYINGCKPFFGIGWRSIDDGWHMRSMGKAKFCTSQSISIFNHDSDKLLILEGMIDYNSLLQMFPAYRSYDAIILNSVTNVGKAIDKARKYKEIFILTDNDNAGSKAVETLLAALPQANDCRKWYSEFNDINQFLQNKLSIN